MRFPSFRNTNLDLLFLVQIKPPRQGGEKYPEPPKSTPFYQSSKQIGEIPSKFTKIGENGVNRPPGGPARPRASQNVAIVMLFADFRAAPPRARLQLFWFFHAKTQNFVILWNFHEKVEFSIKIMENATLAPQKHQFGLVIPCPNRGSAPGGGKVPRNTKNHQFYPKITHFGEIPLKLVKSAFLHRNFDPGTGTLISGLKTFRGVAKYEGYFLWNFMNFHENL